MKRYVASRTGSGPGRGNTRVTVITEEANGSEERHQLELMHGRHPSQMHSPDGFEWGYGGSGPSELARCILWDHLGTEPHPACYQDFKAAFLANAAYQGFTVVDSQISSWLVEWQEANPSFRPTLAHS